MVTALKHTRQEEWCFLSGLISVFEIELLPRAFFLDILRCANIEDIYSRLSKSRYRQFISSSKDVRFLSARVEDFFANEVNGLRQLAPDRTVVDFFVFPEEVRKMREEILSLVPARWKEIAQVVERFCLKVPGNFRDSFGEDCSAYLAKVATGAVTRREFSLFIDVLCLSAISLGWADALPQGTIADAVRSYARYRLVSLVERALESGATSEEILDSISVAPISSALPSNWKDRFSTLNDKFGVPLLRVFGLDSDEERTRSPEFLERIADDAVTERLLRTKHYAFGPEKIFNYLWAINIQNKNLRLCVSGVLGGLPADMIVDKLRCEFV
jgi:hypothetical protein